MGRDGDLAFYNPVRLRKRSAGSRERKGAEGRIVAEASRDRTRDRQRFTRVRECPPSMEGTLGCDLCPIFTEGRCERSWQSGLALGLRSLDGVRKRQGCQWVFLGRATRNKKTPRANRIEGAQVGSAS